MTDRKLVIFDFDGTLADSQPSVDIALAEFSQARLLPFDAKKMAMGHVDPLKYDLGWGIPLEQQPDMHRALLGYYDHQMLQHQRFMPDLYPGINEVIDDLATGYDLGIVTARARSTLNLILDYHDIGHYFKNQRTLCCALERGYPIKPAPDALYCLLRQTKHDIENVVMVGDTTSDILMALNAGAKSIGVTWGSHPREKLATGKPTVIVDKVVDLPATIRRILPI